MDQTTQGTRSLWMNVLARPAPELTGDRRAEVVVVGAGIAGLTTAYLLSKAGHEVLVLDQGGVGHGMTARTTAHLSTALDDRWYKLIAQSGEADAMTAADAFLRHVDFVEEVQRDENIECDFARVDGYLFLADGDERATLEKELDAAHKLGLADVTFDEDCPMRELTSRPCLKFPRQARFHPLKYLDGLARCIKAGGGQIMRAHVNAVWDGDTVTVECEGGLKVQADSAVIATNTPINDRVVIHTKQAPYRSYAVAGTVPAGSVPDVLAWDTGDPYHYIRLQPGEDGTDILIVGGEDHKSGQAHDGASRFQKLEIWAVARFPEITRFTARWSGQVMESADFLGYLGQNPGDKNVFVITGDSGMGMTHGTIGGMIVSDLILGKKNPWAGLFDPARVTPKAAGRFARENLNVAAQYAEYVMPGDVGDVAAIPAGGGAIVRRGAAKHAVYRRADGTLVEKSAVCPHMGCLVSWNPVETCWDCPCHGSQFSAEGEVINGPATVGLASIDKQSRSAHSNDRSAHGRDTDRPSHRT
jgi:glycine/D-amino acid oxidase-like deaminating enzyme/nitrite reductase/ring-hydroxylating ferredoxin subunit